MDFFLHIRCMVFWLFFFIFLSCKVHELSGFFKNMVFLAHITKFWKQVIRL